MIESRKLPEQYDHFGVSAVLCSFHKRVYLTYCVSLKTGPARRAILFKIGRKKRNLTREKKEQNATRQLFKTSRNYYFRKSPGDAPSPRLRPLRFDTLSGPSIIGSFERLLPARILEPKKPRSVCIKSGECCRTRAICYLN